MSEARGRVVDAALHPAPREVEGIRAYLSPSYRQLSFPRPFRYLYPAPTGVPPYGEFRDDSRVDGGMPGSDIRATCAFLDESGTDLAILVPLTRGLMPNLDLGSEICAATNAWLADTWLADGAAGQRFRGSIRVNPEDSERAVAEIDRWSDHPGFVQVAVPLESHHPYGHRLYRRLWEAAAVAGLPVAVHSDGGAGTDFPPTPNGYPRFYVEYMTLYPVNFIYHLSSLIAEGVFDRVPDLRFVFADGGHDVLVPLMWRMDVDWPISRMETNRKSVV